MNTSDEAAHLPTAIGDLVDWAFDTYRAHFGLFALLALAAFAACAAFEFLTPWRLSSADQTSAFVLQLVSLVGDAFVISCVAIAAGNSVGGDRLSDRALLSAALLRWPTVAAATLLAEFVFELTASSGGLGQTDDAVATLLLAPAAWILWGAIGLAGPLAALSTERPALAAFIAFGRSLTLSLRAVNLGRLCIVAFATVVPLMLQTVLYGEFTTRGYDHAAFWAGAPVDAIIVGPLAALQSAFALDFARRSARTTPNR